MPDIEAEDGELRDVPRDKGASIPCVRLTPKL